ncbi:MAG: amidohydrolase family protein [Cyanobacteriota bacterium]
MAKQFYKAKYLLPVCRPVIENAGILVEEGKIIQVGKIEDFLNHEIENAEVVDFEESIILPGLVNAHTHLEYSALGKLTTKSMIDFLWQTIEQTAGWNENKIRDSVKTGIKQSLDCGVVAVGDISRWGISPLVISDYTLLADVALEAFSYDAKSSEKVFELLINKIEYIKGKTRDNVRLSISPHSPYNSDPRLWELMIDYSTSNDMLIHTHLAESLEEKNWFEFGSSEIDNLHSLINWPKITPQITSMSPVEYLSTMQLLSPNLLAAHLCFASSRDLELLEDQNVAVIVCPRSNLALHNKMLEYSLLKSLKIKPILATDSIGSTGNINLLEDVRLYSSKNVIGFEELAKLVTIYPAKALRLDDKIGTLENGKQATFIVFENVDEPANWFYPTKPSAVYINGEPVVNKVSTKG